MKKSHRWILALYLLPIYALAQTPLGQTIQINTHFRAILGEPTWLLIIRNENTGVVMPYIFEVHDYDNFWLAFTGGPAYRVVASTLKFGPYAKINNFCGLEDHCIVNNKSMWVTITGELTPDPTCVRCRVIKYRGRASP